MVAELGQIGLGLALLLAIIQGLCPLISRLIRQDSIALLAEGASRAVFLLTSLAFACLMIAHIHSDFSVSNVWQNSHQSMPLLYKVTGTWGSHEGSLMLWVLILTFCSAAVSLRGRHLPFHFYTTVLAVQGVLSSLFLAFVALTSNPFTRLDPVPEAGRALNPILQDIGLALHPPLLYLGYVGFSIAFSFAIAALIEGKVDGAWARWVRPWSLFAWITLTLGIALGSYWAYYELGWGGWWFWDPVENASLMPWLLGTALIHMLLVVEKRESLKAWTIFLAISTFLLCLLGTFIVRSGVLISVHNFANDPVRGLYILALLAFVAIAGFALFAWRAGMLRDGGHFAPVSREGALIINNFGLMVACLTVFIGTLYPVFWQSVTGGEGASISIGPPFYEATLYPITFLFLTLMPIGPLLAWKRVSSLRAIKGLWLPLTFVIIAQILFLTLVETIEPLSAIGFGLGVWLTLGAFAEITVQSGLGKQPLAVSARRIMNLSRQHFATALGHAGIGLCLLGLSIAGSQQSETIVLLEAGQKVKVGGIDLRFDGLQSVEGPNYREIVGTFVVLENGDRFTAAKRFYPERTMTTTEAGILTRGLSQVYVSLGDLRSSNQISARLYVKPFVLLIWLGAVVMALGGLLSIRMSRRKPSASL